MKSQSEIPQTPLTERAVLSQMMRDDAFRRQAIGEGITGDHFYRYKPVFEVILGLARANTPIDQATVSAALSHDGHLTDLGGQAFVADLWAETNDGKNWRHWVLDLRRSYANRLKVDALALADDCKTPEQAIEALREAEQLMKAALAGPSRSKTAREVMQELRAELELLASLGPIPGVATGIEELDLLTGGMRKGQLWSVLGQTSRGKSVLLGQMGYSAVKSVGKVPIFSAEMLAYEIGARLVAHRGGIELDRVLTPRGNRKGTLIAIQTQMGILADETFWVNDTPKMSLSYVERECQRLADSNNGLGAIVVDYVQILKAEVRKGQNREEVVASISSGLKQLAKAMNCPVITAAQVNKDGKTRESEAIGFDSDVMLQIVDDGIKVMKVRNGKRDSLLPYRLDGATQTFVKFNPEEIVITADQQADTWAAQAKSKKNSR